MKLPVACMLLFFIPFFIIDIGAAKPPVPTNAYPGSLHDLRAEFLVAAECLFTMGNLPAATVACRDKSEIGGELPFVTETAEVSDFRQEGHGYIGTYAGY